MAKRPLHHPSVEALSVSAILHALSDPIRVAIVTELKKFPNGLNCCEVMDQLAVKLPKSSCSQHFQILREAGILSGERQGVELQNKVRTKELEKKFPRLLRTILRAYAVGTKRTPDRSKAR